MKDVGSPRPSGGAVPRDWLGGSQRRRRRQQCARQGHGIPWPRGACACLTSIIGLGTFVPSQPVVAAMSTTPLRLAPSPALNNYAPLPRGR